MGPLGNANNQLNISLDRLGDVQAYRCSGRCGSGCVEQPGQITLWNSQRCGEFAQVVQRSEFRAELHLLGCLGLGTARWMEQSFFPQLSGRSSGTLLDLPRPRCAQCERIVVKPIGGG